MVYEKIEVPNNIWLPKEKGDELEGQIKDIKEGKYGKQYVIETKEGEMTTPSHKVLQNRLDVLEIGNTVKIVFTGTLPPSVRGQNPTTMYDVFVDK